MARTRAVQLVEPGTEGAVECKSPGCNNWFIRNSGRHAYCQAEDCTYKRGAPPARELEEPTGAAEELLRRLQDDPEAEVGPGMYGSRFHLVRSALRARDARALYGALLDHAAAAVWWADRVGRGELPTAAVDTPTSPVAGAGSTPLGLARAAVASHHRTYALGETRVDLIYRLFEAREALVSTETALEQTQGSPHEPAARDANRDARQHLDQVEAALQSVEAAWRERGEVLNELSSAAVEPVRMAS